MAKAFSPWTTAHLPEFAAVLLAAVIGATLWMSVEYRNEVAAVEHTLEVGNKLSQLLSTVQDAETGNRGFLLTGDEVYLQFYDKAIAEIGGELDALQSLIADSPDQSRALTDLRPLIENRFALLKQGIELRRREGLETAARFVQTNMGRNIMLKVREGIAGLQENEAGQLRAQRASTARLIRAATIGAAGGIVLVILSVAGWIWNVRRDARRIANEIGERHQAEAQLRQMQKIEAVGQLTGGIAHDFNNMLAVIISGLSLIKRRLAAGDTNVLELADAAMDGANRAAGLTTRLMAFSRQQPLAPQLIDANKLVHGMSDMINRAIGETIQSETYLAPQLWLVHADPHQLESALLNLCINAYDAMPAGGKLTIETHNVELDETYTRQHGMDAGQYVMIAVSDTGSGMSADTLARAFDPFFTTKETGKGTGLGLSQVHGFVKQSGGHVKAYSEPGHGTSFKIYLPRQHGSLRETLAKHQEPAPGRSGQTILVVEDDERVRELSVQLLRDLSYTVIHADGAPAARRQLAAHPEIALMFTDIVMPETSGRELADEALFMRPDLKVLFTTGFARDAIMSGGVLDRGMNFIAKPFSLEQLAAKIRAVLDETQG